jgi:hypothetical protein
LALFTLLQLAVAAHTQTAQMQMVQMVQTQYFHLLPLVAAAVVLVVRRRLAVALVAAAHL